jgi:hypothetical protein
VHGVLPSSLHVVLTSLHCGTATKFNLKLRTNATVKSC